MTRLHPNQFLHGSSRMVYVPVRIHWSYGDRSGITDHRAIAMPDENEGGHFRLSRYQWEEGNYGCNCNRVRFLGLTKEEFPELYHTYGSTYADGTVVDDEESRADPAPRCMHTIDIHRLESLDPLIPSLDDMENYD